MKIELDFFTNTFYNGYTGCEKIVRWKSDDVIDRLIYQKLKKVDKYKNKS